MVSQRLKRFQVLSSESLLPKSGEGRNETEVVGGWQECAKTWVPPM